MKRLDAILLTAVTGAMASGFRVLTWPAVSTLGATLTQIAQALQRNP
jgi:hypothetical protein